jgi:hypothetical protein
VLSHRRRARCCGSGAVRPRWQGIMVGARRASSRARRPQWPIAIEPRLTVQVNSSGDTRAAGSGMACCSRSIRCRVRRPGLPHRHGNRAHGSRAVTMKSEPSPLATLGSSAGQQPGLFRRAAQAAGANRHGGTSRRACVRSWRGSFARDFQTFRKWGLTVGPARAQARLPRKIFLRRFGFWAIASSWAGDIEGGCRSAAAANSC